jgi:hypothetical protein
VRDLLAHREKPHAFEEMETRRGEESARPVNGEARAAEERAETLERRQESRHTVAIAADSGGDRFVERALGAKLRLRLPVTGITEASRQLGESRLSDVCSRRGNAGAETGTAPPE